MTDVRDGHGKEARGRLEADGVGDGAAPARDEGGGGGPNPAGVFGTPEWKAARDARRLAEMTSDPLGPALHELRRRRAVIQYIIDNLEILRPTAPPEVSTEASSGSGLTEHKEP